MPTLPHAEDPTATTHPGRLRTAWRAAHEPAAGVSRRAQLLACTIPLAVLPSSLWRLLAAFDRGIGIGERAYVVFLSVLSEALAFTAFGLIARWGEVFPRWVPVLRGRRVPTMTALIPAATGAALLTLLFTLLIPVAEISGTTIRGADLPGDSPSEVGGWQTISFYVCYTPLILWGPLLAALTVAYGKRRRAEAVTVAVGAMARARDETAEPIVIGGRKFVP